MNRRGKTFRLKRTATVIPRKCFPNKISIAAYSSLLGGDFGIYQTVTRLKGLIQQALTDPNALIRLRAESLLSLAAERDELDEVSTIFYWVQAHYHYVNDPIDIELIKSPILIDQTISMNGEFMGDCDDVTGYLAALLKSVGYPVGLVIVSPQGSPDFSYRHIFLRVYLSDTNSWLALDATARGKPLGWEVPNQKERFYVI